MGFRKKALNLVSAVREINRKYAHPALKTSRGVKVSLFCLRLYLFLLVGLLFFKFYASIRR